MIPRAAGDETREREIGLELDLLGLGLLPPPTMDAGGHGGGSAAQQWSYEKTGFDEPLRFAAAATETPWAPAEASSPKVLSTPPSSDQLAAGQGRANYAVATLAPPLMQRAPCPTAGGGFFFGTRPPVAAGLIFEASASASASAAAAQSTHDISTAPMTIIYAGTVRAYDGVTLEQAEKILAMVAKEAHAAGILAEPRLELVAAPTGGAAQMTMHWRLAHHVNDSLKMTASLARFLDKRKQRAESAATMQHHPRGEEWFHTQIIMDAPPAATVSARTSVSLGGMARRPRASQDHPKRTKASPGEEAVSTELRI